MKHAFIALVAAFLCFTAGAQEKRMAVVNTSTCYMRLQPNYESALETQELMGTVVEIVGQKSYWREISSPQPYKAWATSMTLVEMNAEQIKAYEKAPKYIFTGLYGHVYTSPNENSETICDLVGGDVMRVVEKDGVRSCTEQWVEVMLPSGVKGWTYKKDVRDLGKRTWIRKGQGSEGLVTSEQIESVIREAMKLRGVPYLWGGMSSKGVDCSGMTRICFLMHDVMLPRNASQQVFCGKAVEIPRPDIKEGVTQSQVKAGYNKDKALKAIANLRRGDLVFFGNTETGRISHVGLYLGDGMMIHSSHLVRVNSLIPGSKDYYDGSYRLIKACRLCY